MWGVAYSRHRLHFSPVLSLLTRLFRPGTAPNHLGRSALVALQTRVELLERSEVVRAAEHAAVIDRLERLYKRVSVRIAREAQSNPTPEPILDSGATSGHESVLSMRKRLGGR